MTANANLRTINETSQDMEDSKGNSPLIDQNMAHVKLSGKKSRFEAMSNLPTTKLQTTVFDGSKGSVPESEFNNQYSIQHPEEIPEQQEETHYYGNSEDSLEEPSNYNLSHSKGSPQVYIFEHEKRRMQEIYDEQLALEKAEIEDALNAYWEKRVEEISRAYEEKLENLERIISKGPSRLNDSLGSYSSQTQNRELEHAIEEKYKKLYLEKLSELEENRRIIEEETITQVMNDFKEQLEHEYQEKLNQQQELIRNEAMKQLELYMKEIEENPGVQRPFLLRSEESDKISSVRLTTDVEALKKEIEANLRSKIEMELRQQFEKEKETLIRRFADEQYANYRKSTSIEENLREALLQETEENARKEIARREKELQVAFRQKLEHHKTELERIFEVELETRLEAERCEIANERIEIARLKSLENLRLKKAEESRKALENKLREQEENSQRKIEELQRRIEELQQKSENQNPNINEAYYRTSSTTKSPISSLPNSGKKSAKPSSRGSTLNTSNKLAQKKSHKAPLRPKNVSTVDSFDRNSEFKQPYMKEHHQMMNRSVAASINAEKEPSENEDPLIELIDPLSPPSFIPNIRGTVFGASEKENRPKQVIQKQTKPESYNRLQPIQKYETQKIAEELLKSYSNPGLDTKVDLSTLVSQRVSAARSSNHIQHPSENLKSQFLDTTKSHVSTQEKTSEDENITLSKAPLGGTEKSLSLKEKYLSEFSKKYDEILKRSSKDTPMQHSSFARSSAKTIDTRTRNSQNSELIGRHQDMEKQTEKSRFSHNTEISHANRASPTKKYYQLFEIKADDSSKVKFMKQLKQEIDEVLQQDLSLETPYLAKEVYFTTEFLTNLNVVSKEYQQSFKNSIRSLYLLWEQCGISFGDRLKFLTNLESMSDFQKVISKVNLEIDYLESHSKNVRELIELVERGYEIRTKIPKDDFNFKSCQNIYNALQENASKLQQLVPLYTTKFKKEIFYRGVNLYDIARCDLWEIDYLRREDMKQEIVDKIRRKK